RLPAPVKRWTGLQDYLAAASVVVHACVGATVPVALRLPEERGRPYPTPQRPPERFLPRTPREPRRWRGRRSGILPPRRSRARHGPRPPRLDRRSPRALPSPAPTSPPSRRDDVRASVRHLAAAAART